MRPTEEIGHGEHGIAGEVGCGDCGEEFAEASGLSGLAGGEAEPRGAAALCGAVLPARGGVSEAPAGAGGTDGGATAGLDAGKSGGGRESGGAASEAVAGFCGGGGSGRGRHHVLPCSAGDAGGGAEVQGDLRGPAGGGGGGGTVRIRIAGAGDRHNEDGRVKRVLWRDAAGRAGVFRGARGSGQGASRSVARVAGRTRGRE